MYRVSNQEIHINFNNNSACIGCERPVGTVHHQFLFLSIWPVLRVLRVLRRHD